jgi:N-acetylglucosamine kinase
MIMGTGVGGGIVCGKGVMHGAHGIAGEWGHNVLIPDGEQCYCGKRGCVETVLSGPALERYYTRLSGSVRPLRDIAGSARTDPAAEQTVKHLVQNFARAIAPVLNILDPHCCIIGGGVGNIGDLYSRETMRLIEADLFGGGLSVPFLRPKLGDSAGVFGAALLVARPLHAR